jgi:hypothetical protein
VITVDDPDFKLLIGSEHIEYFNIYALIEIDYHEDGKPKINDVSSGIVPPYNSKEAVIVFLHRPLNGFLGSPSAIANLEGWSVYT